MVIAQKGSKDIIKIVHVTVVQASFYEAIRILFVRKEKTNNLKINNFCSSLSVFKRAQESTTTHACDVTWTILTMSLLLFWALNVSVVLVSIEVQKALGFPQKYLNLGSEDEQRSYWFETT